MMVFRELGRTSHPRASRFGGLFSFPHVETKRQMHKGGFPRGPCARLLKHISFEYVFVYIPPHSRKDLKQLFGFISLNFYNS